MNTRRVLFGFFLFLLLTVHGVSGNGKREGTIITPESFLRGFDPITVYFDTDLGPSGGGALDEPGDFLRLSPPHPGEYRWIDGRTLSFFPSAAWPILREYRVTVQTRSVTLTTMMAPPTRISPPSGSTQLEPLDTLNLTFSTPMGPDELGEMISFETRPLPGLGDSESLWLTNRDFGLKELDRTSIKDAAQYQLTFNRPIGYGRHITMHLRLSLDENIKGSLAKYSFSTKPEFRLASMGCGSIKYPIATNGSVYSQEQAIACGTGSTPLFLEFTEDLAPLGIDELKSLVRFEPAVKNLSHRISRNLLYLSFEAERDKAYRISVHHQRITSSTGRPLADLGETSLYFYYRQSSPFLRWDRGQSIVERYGPQFFPMSGRATENVDLRIHRVDPLDRNFWPFPKDPVVVDEESRPRMPGEEPAYATQLADQIRLLGSPEISRVIRLPMTGHSGQVRFGLDLEPHLIQISGHWKPGTYLIGYRLLGSSTKRNFVRLSVTDLSLTTVEEEHGINFVVTSLRMGSPIAGAKITVEGDFNGTWRNVIEGTTDEKGQFHYTHERAIRQTVRRIMVSHGDDILVLDPRMPPPHFQNNHWFGTSSSWLAWLSSEPRREKEASRQRAYILTERPVYRPEEPVYILGYVRQRQEGKILAPDFKRQRSLIIDGPGKKYWTFPISLEEGGQFSFKFHEEDLPTGDYTAILRDDQTGGDLSVVTFKKESYRIPRFEARISGPDRVALDQPFELVLTADYYAGGRVVGQQVSWEITQYPYQVSPPHYPGYLFSTDDRFTGGRPFRSTGSSRKSDVTDENGSSRISLNPAL
ncbi:MAG TPA: MG2 domain-containing protein, partial [Spirochaetia bacterium]|nr:MG2 domain-containing protein [Spirochaetia bacterium]